MTTNGRLNFLTAALGAMLTAAFAFWGVSAVEFCGVWAAEVSGEPLLNLSATDDSIFVDVANLPKNNEFENGDAAERIALVRCRPCEYYPTTDFLARFDGIGNDCEDDGYDVDRRYYDPENVAAFVEISDVGATLANGAQTMKIQRFSADERDSGRDKIFDKFYLIAGGEVGADVFLRGGRILAGPRFVVDFPSKNTEARVAKRSIKGLEVFDVADAKNLGVVHAARTIDLCWLLQERENPAETVEFRCDDKVYRFNKAAVDEYDAFVREATAAEMEITFVLVLWGHRRHLAPPGTIHPDFEVWLDAPWTLSIVAPNLTNREGCDRWRALFEFLGDRYLRRDRKFGFVSNFVVGNELNSSYIWNNCGRLPLDETVRQYERGLRIAHTALRKYWSGANVLASFDNYWSADSSTEFQQFHYVEKGGFAAKDYLTELAATTRAGGDYPWNVAFHPYGLDLRTPIYWDRHSVESAAKDENAKRLTPWNIEVLPQFLDRPEMRFDGRRRDFYFTEQGFSSPHCDNYGDYDSTEYDPNAIPEVWLERQAAAFAFAHYKFVAIGAKANIFHRQFDVRSERLNIGLWARPKGAETGKGRQKTIYELFQKIDGPDSEAASARFLEYLRFYPQTEPPKSWDELIPNFDAVRATFLNR